MLIGVFAPNIRAGGGLRHLAEVLGQWPLDGYEGDELMVWASPELARLVGTRPRLTLRVATPGGGRLMAALGRLRMWWPAETELCDVLYVPGGTFLRRHRALVYMSQNVLPFMLEERSRYGWGLSRLRLELLQVLQSITLRHSRGAIFLTSTARELVTAVARFIPSSSAIVPHGIDPRFFMPPRPQLTGRQPSRPYRILYVSVIAPYKHQWNVVEAVAALRKKGWLVELILAGGADKASARRLQDSIAKHDPDRAFTSAVGSAPADQVHQLYHQSDLFVFASTCENLPNILLEAMAAGLPIACSNRPPMPALLGEAGTLFDPVDPRSLELALEALLEDPHNRERLARLAFERAQPFSWRRCAEETMSYLRTVGTANQASGLATARQVSN